MMFGLKRIILLGFLLFAGQSLLAQAPVTTYMPDGSKKIVTKLKDGKTKTVVIDKNGNEEIRINMGRIIDRAFDPDTIDKNHIVIQVYKQYNRMYVYYHKDLLTCYNVVFGKKPRGQKLREGDFKTPEGWFSITKIRKHGKWSWFLDIDYPNLESQKNHSMAKEKGLIPSNSKIGGLIGIHGVWPGGDDAIKGKFNWTDGCVSMRNGDVAKLAKIVKPGTRVYIGWSK